MRCSLLIGICALLLAGCGSESTTPPVASDAAELPADQVIFDLRQNMSRDGIRSGVLESDTALMYETGMRLDLRGVELRFFGETGRLTGTLTSETGEYQLDSGSFIARGNVVLITEGAGGEERRLETEELHYDVENDRLWSDVPFVLHQQGRVTRGRSFESDSRFESWEAMGLETEGGLPQGGPGVDPL